jgi:hypothetical protein
MTSPRHRHLAWILAAAACVVPTDRGAELLVDAGQTEVQLLLGERTTLEPAVSASAGGAAPAVTFTFSSSDPAVVAVDSAGTVLAAGVGSATVSIGVRTYEGAIPDSVTVRVIDNVRFDLVAPDTARFGDTLTIVGAALDPASLALVAVGGLAAPVASFAPQQPGVAGSRDTLRIVVPVGAAQASDVVALHDRGASDNAAVTVLQTDRFEPNDIQPVRIDAPVGFSSSFLALEGGAERPIDWYRLGPIAETVTVELRLGMVRQFGLASIMLSAPAERGDAPDWSVRAMTLPWDAQQGAYVGAPVLHCRGLRAEYNRATIFFNRDFSDDVIRLPLLDFAADSVDLLVELLGATEQPWAYEARIVPGYVSQFPPDAYEENDLCELAPTISTGAFALTLDHQFDVDWFRINVADVARQLTVSASFRGGPSTIADVDMMLYRDTDVGVGAAGNLLPVVVQSTTDEESLSGTVVATETFTVSLDPGAYLLLVRNSFAYAVENLSLSVSITP